MNRWRKVSDERYELYKCLKSGAVIEGVITFNYPDPRDAVVSDRRWELTMYKEEEGWRSQRKTFLTVAAAFEYADEFIEKWG